MNVVSSKAELLANISLLKGYLQKGSSEDSEFAKGLIKRGTCFVIVDSGEEPFFAPSRFTGYVDNSRLSHLAYYEKDGRETNDAISILFGNKTAPNDSIDSEYCSFCERLGLRVGQTGAYGAVRKYWDLRGLLAV